MHPLYQQSQVDFDQPDLDMFPEYASLDARTVVLEPGDVLYIPPFWWQHSETLSPSVSVSTWSHHSSHANMDDVYSVLPHASQLMNQIARVYATRTFIGQLLTRMIGHHGMETFVGHMIDSRYQGLRDMFHVSL
jgi:ribosomal protein L16 Arg81 hydroxylase